jgi:hypothetical protein
VHGVFLFPRGKNQEKEAYKRDNKLLQSTLPLGNFQLYVEHKGPHAIIVILYARCEGSFILLNFLYAIHTYPISNTTMSNIDFLVKKISHHIAINLKETKTTWNNNSELN